MDVQVVADAGVEGGDDEGLVGVDEAEVADEGLVEDGVDGGAVVGGALGQAADADAVGAGPPRSLLAYCYSTD